MNFNGTVNNHQYKPMSLAGVTLTHLTEALPVFKTGYVTRVEGDMLVDRPFLLGERQLCDRHCRNPQET